MTRYARIEITKEDNGMLSAGINADISITDIVLAFAIITQKIIKGEVRDSKDIQLGKFDLQKFDERFKRK